MFGVFGENDNGVWTEESVKKVTTPSHSYKVTLQTADSKWGGTDGQVFVTLHGDRRKTNEINFKHGVLQRGSMEEDTFSAAFVGNLLSITIRHDGVGWAGAWHLKRVKQIRKSSIQRLMRTVSGSASRFLTMF